MLQRSQRNNLDQIIAFTREQIQNDLTALKDNRQRIQHLSKTATSLLTMYTNLSYPLMGLQLIKQNLTTTKHSHSIQIEMILDKAELFYLESVKLDLGKLKNDQKIQHLSAQDIKEYIEEINWKLGFERESILNQSQEIGDNIDLMKFFQGVRNFQNWEENLEKRTIEKLKKFSNKIQNQLTLRKGFLISKLQQIHKQKIQAHNKHLIASLQRDSKINAKLSIFQKIAHKKISDSFTLIKIVTQTKNWTSKLRNWGLRVSSKTYRDVLMAGMRKIVKIRKNVNGFVRLLNKIQERKLIISQAHFMKKITLKPYQNCESMGRGSEKLQKWLKKYAMKQISKSLGIAYLPMQKILSKLYTFRLQQTISQIKTFLKDRKAHKQMVSYKVKGRILLSIQRYENKPINIRKTFLDWYLKSHQEKYSKMIYNIWLNGNTSKFTFFMRLKNMINDGKKQKIRQELKVFLMILMQKIGDYYKHCQKGYIEKWLDRHRYCKKLNLLLKQLDEKSVKIDQRNIKDSMEIIKTIANQNRYLSTYFRKRMNSMQRNCQIGFNVWKCLPNLKKSRGRSFFLNFMHQKLENLDNERKLTFERFKEDGLIGREKKIRFMTKHFTKDCLYLSIFLSIWRRNKEQIITNESHQLHSTNQVKQHALKTIEYELKHRETMDAKQVIMKILMRTTFIKRRQEHTKGVFSKMLSNVDQQNLKSSFNEMKAQNFYAKLQKQNLVKWLVNSNKAKQAQSLKIWNTGSQVQKQMQKRSLLSQIFNKINDSIKLTCDEAFSSRYVYLYLQRFITNYSRQVASSFEYIRRLPERIDWNKKKNTLDLVAKLGFVVNRGKIECYQKFKSNRVEGLEKKKRAVDKMANFWTHAISKAFQLYREEATALKRNEKNYVLIKMMENWETVQRKSFDYLMKGQNIWKKKSESFYKLNIKVKERLLQSYKLWHNTAKDLTFLRKMTNQKKKRVLENLSVVLFKNQNAQTKKCVSLFMKNKKIIELQTNFLRKLCDSQAGKVIKAMMIWKNLPKPQNKEKVAKASKFERNLFNFSQKLFRTSFGRFKDEQYFGNDRKKQAIRNLVARSCSGIEKYFAIWNKNMKMVHLFSQCHKLEKIMETLLEIEQNNFKLAFNGTKSVKAKKSFENLERWWNKHGLRVLKTWRNKVILLKKEDKQKSKNLRNLATIAENVQKSKAKEIIQIFKKRRFLKNFLSKVYLQNRMLNIYNSVEKIRTLPDRIFIKKNQNKRKSVIAFMAKLEKEVKDDKAKLLQFFRDQRYTGNFKKLKSCEKYLKDKISHVHKILTLWVNMKRADHQKRKQESTSILFQRMLNLTSSNFNTILQSVRLTQIKKHCFDRLFNVLEIKKKGMFMAWRSTAKQIKMMKMLDLSNKKVILEKINKIISASSQETVKKAIKNFYLHSKITKIQVKFIQKLLQTKSGKVVEAFNQWKKIPNQNIMQKYKKGQKFFFKLEGMIKKKITQVNSTFKGNGEEGSTAKKQSVLKLLEITSSGIRKFYNRWIRITKRDHTLMQANATMHSLDSIQNCVADVFKILFEDQRSTRVKTWAIEKLIKASSMNCGVYFLKWREAVREYNIAKQFEKANKQTAIKMFSQVLGGSQVVQIRDIIQKFQKNSSIKKISRNFLNRLLKTKSGKVIQLFEIWKSIPDAKLAKKKKKAIKFQSNLNRFSQRFIKTGFEPFKISSHQARSRKKRCIEKLIRASMGEEKKKFILWREIVKQEKMLKHTHLFDSIFENLQSNISGSFGILVKNSAEEVRIKKNLCRRLLNNASFVQHHAYLIWKEALQSDNVKIEKTQSKVRSNLQNLITVNNKLESRKLVQIIASFKKQLTIIQKQSADLHKQSKNRKAINFFTKLSQFSNKNICTFLTEIKKSNNQFNFLNKNKSVERSFESMNLTLTQNLLIMFRSNRQTVIMERAINRIFDNLKLSSHKAFHLWREYKNILRIQQSASEEKKKKMLEILTKCLNNHDGIRIPYAISKFEKNYKSLKLRKQILTKILQCKAGKVPLAFMIWKALPNVGIKKMKLKAMKFESGLARLVNKNLRGTYEKFKDETYEGNNKKKLAVRKLILVTMSGSNKYFNKWRKVNSQAIITSKMLALTKFFESSTDSLSQHFKICDTSLQEYRKKVNAVQKMGHNMRINLSSIMKYWRNGIQENKCVNVVTVLEKFLPLRFNGQLVKFAFLKIKSKSDMEALRIYINSLWKWKLSNIEANYYSKFIKIFKESEQLLILSDCLNRKKQEHLHFSFRRILSESTNRQTRKTQITQKYLTRKINNYFQRFKLNAMLQEISTWKKLYTSTIKAKKLIGLLDQFARKQIYESYHCILKHQVDQKNCEKFMQRIERFQAALLRNCLKKMQVRAGVNRMNILFNVLDKLALKVKGEALNDMLEYTKVTSITRSIQKIASIYKLRNGYNKIHYKSVLQVKCKLAINLLSLLQKQKLSSKVQISIFKFKKNWTKLYKLSKVLTNLSEKQTLNAQEFYKILRDGLDKKTLISRFKKGMVIKKILEKGETKVLRRMFGLMKKKENKWVLESVKRFVIRSSIKSSQAVSLWRMRSFQAAAVELAK